MGGLYEILNMILLDINIGSWLLEQAPVIVVMGVVIWWLARQYLRKDKQLTQVSEKAIQLSTKWEEKAEYYGNKNRESHKEIMDGQENIQKEISEIKGMISK